MYGSYSSLYAQWCDCYDHNGTEISLLAKHVDFENKTILDIGCGTGRFIFKVLPFAAHIIGVDNDPESIKILNESLAEKYSKYKSKVEVCCQDIENYQTTTSSVDLAVFTWSFYALNKRQARTTILNLNSIIKKDGIIIVLQPVGGEFEKVMRYFFAEHENMDEYESALSNMNKVFSPFFSLKIKERLTSEFIVKDVAFMTEALKMFATTEGGCSKADIICINEQTVQQEINKYKFEDGYYHFSDEVDMFIYKRS